jgi:hypothetical protein
MAEERSGLHFSFTLSGQYSMACWAPLYSPALLVQSERKSSRLCEVKTK